MKNTISTVDDKGKQRPLVDIEKEVVLNALASHDNNITLTAAALKIGRTTLYRKLEAFGYEVVTSVKVVSKR